MNVTKPIHTLVLDAGPLIKNTPTVSSLLASSTTLLTHPAVISEIRDEATRARLEHTLRPFLSLREPKPESVKFVRDFARRSGDLEVLSRPDVLLLALTYEVECERNGGDWRLRKTPGQKGVNGKPPGQVRDDVDDNEGPGDGPDPTAGDEAGHAEKEDVEGENEAAGSEARLERGTGAADEDTQASTQPAEATQRHTNYAAAASSSKPSTSAVSQSLRNMQVSPKTAPGTPPITSQTSSLPTTPPSDPPSPTLQPTDPEADSPPEEEHDDEGWITPSNLSHHQAKDARSQSLTTASNTNPTTSNTSNSTTTKPPTLQSALLTTDHAMQNVALLLNLNLLSSSLTRITQLKTTTQRCHACFFVMRPKTPVAASPLTGGPASGSEKPKHFCPRCGLPALTQVTCSTDSRTGKFQVHLKKNMQWNTKGDRFNIPKPVAGSAGARGAANTKGGGKGGWGSELLLAEDQKEYVKAVKEEEREMRKTMKGVDEDLVGLFGGGGGRSGGRVKVGAGRDVNSKKRR